AHPRVEPEPVAAEDQYGDGDGGDVAEEDPAVAEDLAGVQLLQEDVVPFADLEDLARVDVDGHLGHGAVVEADLDEAIAGADVHAVDAGRGDLRPDGAGGDIGEGGEGERVLEGAARLVGGVWHEPERR